MNEILALIVLVISWLFVITPALGYRDEAYSNYYSTCFKRGVIGQFKLLVLVGFLCLMSWAFAVFIKT